MRATDVLRSALMGIVEEMGLNWPAKAVIEPPRDPKHGDLAANIAMLLAREAHKNPRELAQIFVEKLPQRCADIEKVEVAGPGFCNVTFSQHFWRKTVCEVEAAGAAYGQSSVGQGRKTLVEYVSANPTGPLHVGHGRGAAVGDSLARLLRKAGFDVETEYYINDAGRQMRILGLSVWLRVKELAGRPVEWPEDYYRGSYIIDIAREMLAEDPDNKHLQRQLTRVYLAQISTVHAFCQTVLRQYAAEADLPADFRVADEQQAAALRAEALQDTLAELYAGLDANPDFAAMIDTLGYGRDDRRLLALAEESYGVMRCQVDPAAWTRRCLQAYDLPEDAEAEQTLWGAWFLQERTRVLENADALLRQAEDLCRREPKLEEKCTPVLEKNRAAIRNLLAETTWDGCMEKKIASFGAMRPPKDAEAVEQVLDSPAVADCVSRGEEVTLTVVGENEGQSMRLLAGLEGCAAGRKNTFCCAAQPEEVALAHEAGLSYGKYRAFLEAQALDPSLTPQEVQGMSMREIRELTEALAAGEEPVAQEGAQPGRHGGGGGNGKGNQGNGGGAGR